MTTPVDAAFFARTTDQLYTLDEFRAKVSSGKPLRIKYGVDATAPFLHIGHAVNLWMMRELQEHGHIVVFLIGDFTTQIGDPTGRSKTRTQLSIEEIEANAHAFIDQVGQVVLTSPEVFEVRRNSEWWDKMSVGEFMSLLSMVTHSRLIQRDMFQKRIELDQEIYMHELLYPVLQGYDSYMLGSDLTIVGTDQLYNEMMGRFFQEKFGHEPQIVITTKITPGIDGRQKQSKSLGNYIALSDTPRDKYGKIMSIPDRLIPSYLEVYTTVPLDEVHEIEQAIAVGELNPRDAKQRLAFALVERYHSTDVAYREEAWFTSTFSLRVTPEDVPVVQVNRGLTLLEILQGCLPDHSKSKLRNLIAQGAVRLNGARLEHADARPDIHKGDVIKVGAMRWFKLSLG